MKKRLLLLPFLLLGASSAFTQETNPEPQNEKPQMTKLDSIEIVPFGPYRFIGRSVYASPFHREAGGIYRAMWENSDWIFEELDKLQEYASDDTRHHAFQTWEKYDEKTKLMGYTVGRFMKPGTPVPEGMDYFDVEATAVAKGFIKSKNWEDGFHSDKLTRVALDQQNYNQTSWKWYTEAYPAGYPKKHVPDENGDFLFGTYISCEKK